MQTEAQALKSAGIAEVVLAQKKLIDAHSKFCRANKLSRHVPEMVELQQLVIRLSNLLRGLGKLEL